jgi:hypothetical protein
MRWRGLVGGPVVLVIFSVAGCRCSSRARRTPEAQAAASAAPVPDFTPGPPERVSPLTQDALWKRAETGDDIDLARLAQREGARGLMRGVEAGGTLGLTALRALPRANDAELALGRLCEILHTGDAEKLEPVLRAVQAIVAKPPRGVEQLDPEGMDSCAPVLAALVQNPRLSPSERDFALSARAMLAEHAVKP